MTKDSSRKPSLPKSRRGMAQNLTNNRFKKVHASSASLLFSTPALAWYAFFTILPLINLFYLSMSDWGSLVSEQRFVGLEQYQRVLADGLFWTSAFHTVVQLSIAVPVMLFLGLMLAYYLTLNLPGVNLLRVLCFTPALMSISAKSMMFLGVLSPDGILNYALRSIGLEAFTTAWLANEKTSLGVIIAIDIWSGIGFTALLLAVRLSGIPKEILEAATLDGAGHWRKIWEMSFPIMKDYFGGLFMLQFIWIASNSAAVILLLTNGGPGTSSYTLGYLIFAKAFTQQSVGYSQVAAVSLFFLGLAGMLVIRRIFRSVT